MEFLVISDEPTIEVQGALEIIDVLPGTGRAMHPAKARSNPPSGQLGQMNSKQIVTTMRRTGSVVVRGTNEIQAVRGALIAAMRELRIQVVFDPRSDRELVDYLGIATLDGLEAASIGLALGALFGSLVGDAKGGAAAGTLVGGLCGLMRGVNRVNGGWRILMQRDSNGQPVLTVNAIG